MVTVALVLLAVVLWMASVLVGTRNPRTPVVTQATAYLGTDGHRERLALSNGGFVTLEWGSVPGWRHATSGFPSGPFPVPDAATRDWVRLTIAGIGADGTRWRSDTLTSNTERGLETFADGRTEGTVFYQQPRLDLPSTVAAGARWTSSGTARLFGRDQQTRDLQFGTEGTATASAGRPDCLDLDTTEHLGDLPALRQVTTWCKGRGIVAQRSDGVTAESVSDFSRTSDPRERVNASQVEAPTGVETWVATTVARQYPFAATPVLTPGLSGDGGYVFADSQSGDLIGMAVAGAVTAPAWRAHPGAQIVGVGTFGDVTVASTSGRTLVAYDATGQWLWTTVTADVTATPPVRLNDDLFCAAGLDGTVSAYDIRTGAEVWKVNFFAEVRVPPAARDGVVYLVDNSGVGAVLDAATGAVLWHHRIDPGVEAVAVGAGAVIVSGSRTPEVTAFDARTGAVLWNRFKPAAVPQILPQGTSFLLRSNEGLLSLDARSGHTRWTSSQAAVAALVAGDRLVFAAGGLVGVLDDQGRLLQSWPVRINPQSAVHWLVHGRGRFAYLDGVGAMVSFQRPG